MKDYGLYQYYITTSTTTIRSYHDDDEEDDHIELDDTAPLPLFIGIGLALFIGFVILVLICCFCRRRRVPSPPPPDRPVNTTHYQRAPMNDGMGVGTAYPLSSVPPLPYPNSTIGYPPPHLGPTIQHNYGVIGTGVNYNNPNHVHYPQQPPQHFGVPNYGPNHYIAALPLAPHSTPLQSHSPSHSSQASSSVSGATADPLMPSSSPFIPQQPPPQYHHLQAQKFHQLSHQQHMQPASALQHHQHMQQQQFMSGRQSPAMLYSQMSYSAVGANDHFMTPRPDLAATIPTVPPSSQINSPVSNRQQPPPPQYPGSNHQQPPPQQQQSQQMTQLTSYAEDENEKS